MRTHEHVSLALLGKQVGAVLFIQREKLASKKPFSLGTVGFLRDVEDNGFEVSCKCSFENCCIYQRSNGLQIALPKYVYFWTESNSSASYC